MAQQQQQLPLAVRSALARLQGEEARSLASHPQLRRLAAAAAFDAALDLASSSSASFFFFYERGLPLVRCRRGRVLEPRERGGGGFVEKRERKKID